jgi:uncharacterized membrane protein
MNGAADHTRGIRRKAVSKNIDSIVALEKEDERKLSRLHRASHTVGWFVGTIHFVILQLFFVVAWVVWNAYGPFASIRTHSRSCRLSSPSKPCF